VGRGHVGRQREGAQRRVACRLDVHRIALLENCRKVGASQIRERGRNLDHGATIFSSSGIAVSSDRGR
jgi:hypothetical protein